MEKTYLLDLPVCPDDRDDTCGTSIIGDAYLQERDNVKSPDELRVFINRWQKLWLLSGDYEQLSDEEKALVSNEMCHEQVYVHLKDKREDNIDFSDVNVRIMANIVMPHPLLKAFMLSRKFGVGSDLAMVRLYLDPFPGLQDAMRSGCKDPRPILVQEVTQD